MTKAIPRPRSGTLLIALVLAATGELLAATPDLLERALRTLGTADEGQWAYTETMVRESATFVHRYDPTLPEADQSSLVSVDGRPPTEEERAEHATSRDREDRSGDDEQSGTIRAIIAPGSLSLLREDEVHALYAFRPVAEDDGDAELYEHLDATLRVVKSGPYVDRIELSNPGPFSPQFGVKVKEFSMVLTFAPQDERSAVLPRTESFRLLGRAMLVKKLDVAVELTFDDYRYVGD